MIKIVAKKESNYLSFSEIKNVPGIYRFTKPDAKDRDHVRIIVLELRDEKYLILHLNIDGFLVLNGEYEDTYPSNDFSFEKVNEDITIE